VQTGVRTDGGLPGTVPDGARQAGERTPAGSGRGAGAARRVIDFFYKCYKLSLYHYVKIFLDKHKKPPIINHVKRNLYRIKTGGMKMTVVLQEEKKGNYIGEIRQDKGSASFTALIAYNGRTVYKKDFASMASAKKAIKRNLETR